MWRKQSSMACTSFHCYKPQLRAWVVCSTVNCNQLVSIELHTCEQTMGNRIIANSYTTKVRCSTVFRMLSCYKYYYILLSDVMTARYHFLHCHVGILVLSCPWYTCTLENKYNSMIFSSKMGSDKFFSHCHITLHIQLRSHLRKSTRLSHMMCHLRPIRWYWNGGGVLFPVDGP